MESLFLLAFDAEEFLAALAMAGSEAFFNKLLIGTQPGYPPDLTNRWLQQHGTAIVTLQSRDDAAKSNVCEHSFALPRGSGYHFGDVFLARSFVLGF
jgi:hypothetical protein